MKIKKAIIPIAGSGTRFLPLSKVLPKEIWPLVDKPIIQYIVEEAINSGIKEIIFVVKPDQRIALNYFTKELDSKKLLKGKGKDHLLEEIKKLERIYKKVTFSFAVQEKPLGDGHSILQAEKLVKGEPCAVLFGDDVVEGKIPCLKQLLDVYEKYQQPVIALSRVPKASFNFYGMAKVKKLDNRLYQITKLVEKPLPEKSPSNLALIGKYIITPETFEFLKKNPPSARGEIALTETIIMMIENGRKVQGYEVEGKWLECGNKLAYLKSNFYLSLKHSQYAKELKSYLKKENLLK